MREADDFRAEGVEAEYCAKPVDIPLTGQGVCGCPNSLVVIRRAEAHPTSTQTNTELLSETI
jgi:hypothetical protein